MSRATATACRRAIESASLLGVILAASCTEPIVARPADSSNPSLAASGGPTALREPPMSQANSAAEAPATGQETPDAALDCPALGDGDCDPFRQCGCGAGERCQFARLPQTRCYPEPAGGGAKAGQPCVKPGDCATGTECSAANVCAAYCHDDRDCNAGSCRTMKDKGRPVAGYTICYHRCDPVSGDGCESGSICTPTNDLAAIPTAYCRGPEIAGAAVAGADEVCTRDTQCGNGLGCWIKFQADSGLCTPWCKTDRDCPAEHPTCLQTGTDYEDSKQAVGHCISTANAPGEVPAGCSFSEPTPWNDGPGWSQDDSARCSTLCPTGELGCVQSMCPNGQRYILCVNTVLTVACGAVAAPCRKEYIDRTCCEQACVATDQPTTCIETMCATQVEAMQTCVMSNPDCLRAPALVCSAQ